MTPDKVTTKVKIDFKGAKGSIKEAIKEEVGEFVVKEIISHLKDSESPVSGGKFKVLKKDNFKSRLFDVGDLWDSIEFVKYRDGIEVGVFDSSEVGKAYGHNSGFRGHPTIPEGKYKREFIPTGDKEFKSSIISGVKDIVRKKLDGT